MTHRFHLWYGRAYEFVARRRNWGEDRVYFHDEDGVLQVAATAHRSDHGRSLAAYRTARQLLVEQNGLEPGSALSRLHSRS